MARKGEHYPVVDPNGDCFEGTDAAGAFHVEGRGVVVRGEHGSMLHFIEEPDNERGKRIRDEIVKIVVQLNEGIGYEPKWPTKVS